MLDTLRTAGTGIGGFWLSMWNVLPDIVSLAVGLTTLTYMIIKLKKELR